MSDNDALNYIADMLFYHTEIFVGMSDNIMRLERIVYGLLLAQVALIVYTVVRRRS